MNDKNVLPIPQLSTNDGNIYILKDRYVINFSKYFNFDIVVPKNYKSDLASVPKLLRWIIDRASLGLVAPLLHDYICFKKGRIISIDGAMYELTWFECHLLFLLVMNITGIHWFRATLCFLAVLIGVKYWENNKY
jgi:hypothetical protein